jgi:hypothetical protein
LLRQLTTSVDAVLRLLPFRVPYSHPEVETDERGEATIMLPGETEAGCVAEDSLGRRLSAHNPRGSHEHQRRPYDATSVAKGDMKFEVVVIPVSDVDRAKEFYGRLGWRLDADYDNGNEFA